jgi:hypothetical protein
LRFVITGEWDRNYLLRLILFFFLIFVALLWITNWVLYFEKMGLTPSSVSSYYLGDPEADFGQPPRPVGALAGVSHMHLFSFGVLVMTLTHLLLFLPVSNRLKGSLILITFVSALLNEGSSWLVRFVHPAFSWLKIASFLALQVTLLLLVIALLIGVLRPNRNAYADSQVRPRL